MEETIALKAFSALAQETRLNVFRMLIEYGSTGAPAGEISERLSIPHNTLSFHLSHLSHAGLISSRKEGRSIIYSANCELINQLVNFLNANCCILATNTSENCAEKSCSIKSKSQKEKKK